MGRTNVTGALCSDRSFKWSYRGGNEYVESRLFENEYTGVSAWTTLWHDGRVIFEVRDDGQLLFALTIDTEHHVDIDKGADLVRTR